MKWILLGVGAFVLIAALAVFILWRIMQQSIKDKGGMENPHYTGESTFSAGEDNTDKPSETALVPNTEAPDERKG